MKIGGTAYGDIYELMEAEIGTGETDIETLEMFMLEYGEYYINAEEYYNMENNKFIITLTKPDNTEETIYPWNYSAYTVTSNGNYTFKAKNANGDIGAITVKVGNIIEEKYSNIYSSTELYTDKNGDTAWIPKGFAVGTNKSKNTEIDTVENGLVITDKVDSEGNSIGNEFVWVPVTITGTTQEEKEASFEAIKTAGYLNGSLQTNLNISEPLESGGYDGEVTDYNAMKTSIIEHGGFYIGRYEAGTTTPRYDKANGTTQMIVQRGYAPYNYVGWGNSMSDYTSDIIYNSKNQGKGALYLSKNMYTDENKYEIVSTLCYGIQWDATMKFVEDSTHSISDSTSWGNYSNNTLFKYTGKYCSNPSSTTKPNWYEGINETKGNITRLLTTGASETNKVKNIYDLAGNVSERTNEAYSSFHRVYRGGQYNFGGSYYTASSRYSSGPTSCNGDVGFRPALYITNEYFVI